VAAVVPEQEESLLAWARPKTPYTLTRFVILRALGALYSVAFWSLFWQWRPLFGADGLLPAGSFLERVRENFGSLSAAFWRLPTIFWWGHGDRSLGLAALLGLALSLLLLIGVENAPLLAVLWALYLSFVHVGQIFYGYGWESLLCEAGFLAIFLAPAWRAKPFSEGVPWPVVVLFRWLTFRVMFGAGLIKIRGDSCWTDLTCLAYHYETQPLPNPLSAAFHRLPESVHAFGVLFNHFAELVAPFGVFGPRRVRYFAGTVIIAFQLALILSGNLAFLNWLTIAAALSCFDDTVFSRLLPRSLWPRFAASPAPLGRARRIVTGVLVFGIACLSLNPVVNLLSPSQRMNAAFDPFEIVNTYGAFGSITRERNEIVIEGTSDSQLGPETHWVPYELPCKPGDPARQPCMIAPFQYKLDWQLWFAAFGEAGGEPWFIHLVYKLLHGDPIVDPLFAVQPFHGRAPRYVRALFYRYRFAPHAAANVYWQRELLGEYLSPMGLGDPRLERYVERHGWRR